MTAYVIVDVTQIHNEPLYARYRDAVPSTIAASFVVVAGVGDELPQ